MMISRRQALQAGAALTTGAIVPRLARAADPLVVATFPGTWNEAHRNVLAPYFKKRSGADVNQTILLATDQVARMQAARGKPPFDVAIMDEGPLVDAAAAGVLEKYPAEKSPHYADLLPQFRNEWGPTISIQVIGIGYNPKKIKTPPKSWEELWNPAYKGRVGLTALNSTLGQAFMVELARLKGGSETNIDPAFAAIRTLLPNVGAIAANLGAYATLWQQEQIDIAPYNFNFVQTLKDKGVDVEFAIPETGGVAWRTSLHLVKNAQQPDFAVQYIDSHLAPEVQRDMEQGPYYVIPTSGKVSYEGRVAQQIAKSADELGRFRYQDWSKISPNRSEWIERFNREIKL
jgi:putative spermidine/putrescine transport system substrate-binding protein